MAYSLAIHRAAQKQMMALPREAQMETGRAIDGLRDNARPSGSKKLRETGLWRVRVGRYRVVYAIDDDAKLVTILKVAIRREDTYKGL